MKRIRGATLLAMLAVPVGCVQTSTKPISVKEIADTEEGFHSAIDIKIVKYQELAREFPKVAKYQERLGRLYWAKEDHRNALVHLKKARKLDPRNPKYDYLEGKVYHSIGNFMLAEAAYKNMFKKVPEDKFSGLRKDFAQLYLDEGRYEEAKVQLERCLEIDSSFPLAHYLLGQLSLARGDQKKALEYFESYLRLGGVAHHDEVRQTLQRMQPELFSNPRVFYRPQVKKE